MEGGSEDLPEIEIVSKHEAKKPPRGLAAASGREAFPAKGMYLRFRCIRKSLLFLWSASEAGRIHEL